MNDHMDSDTNIPRESRFSFGKNWKRFLKILNEERILRAENSLKDMLGLHSLEGMTFLDIGCGSGLYSMAALRLGASKVVSFDYDLDSVNCAHYLNKKYGPFNDWEIYQGSVLDKQWLSSLGKFDVVYSWGVLHHTGDMYQALSNAAGNVNQDGYLYVSIYNDQGSRTKIWKKVKWFYNVMPKPIQFLIGNSYFLFLAVWLFFLDLVQFRSFTARYTGADRRGMNAYYDAIDWIGGYPFEAAKPEEIFKFYKDKGFILDNIKVLSGIGCSEYVFLKTRS